MTISLKYFRTKHTPWSKGATKDDERVDSVDHFIGKELIVSEKLDGENQTWTHKDVFARSHAAQVTHESNVWSKRLHREKHHLIDPELSVYFEYTYAMHSIWYEKMAKEKAYVHIIGVKNDVTGVHWCWDDVIFMATVLELPTVPVLWRGTLSTEKELLALMPGDGKSPSAWGEFREGEVGRLASEFTDPDLSIMKSVRPGHVKTDKHWKRNWKPMHEVFK